MTDKPMYYVIKDGVTHTRYSEKEYTHCVVVKTEAGGWSPFAWCSRPDLAERKQKEALKLFKEAEIMACQVKQPAAPGPEVVATQIDKVPTASPASGAPAPAPAPAPEAKPAQELPPTPPAREYAVTLCKGPQCSLYHGEKEGCGLPKCHGAQPGEQVVCGMGYAKDPAAPETAPRPLPEQKPALQAGKCQACGLSLPFGSKGDLCRICQAKKSIAEEEAAAAPAPAPAPATQEERAAERFKGYQAEQEKMKAEQKPAGVTVSLCIGPSCGKYDAVKKACTIHPATEGTMMACHDCEPVIFTPANGGPTKTAQPEPVETVAIHPAPATLAQAAAEKQAPPEPPKAPEKKEKPPRKEPAPRIPPLEQPVKTLAEAVPAWNKQPLALDGAIVENAGLQIVVKHLTDTDQFKDSIEIAYPTKEGVKAFKVYVDSHDIAGSEQQLNNMLALVALANQKIQKSGGVA